MDPSHEVHADVAGIVASVPGDDISSDHVAVHGDGPAASSAFDVDRMLAASAGYCVAAADAIAARREVVVPERVIDRAHLAAFCTTHVMLDGAVVPGWADLSGVYPTADGRHLQVHCNFPHHGDGVVRRLGCASDPDSVAAAIATRNAFDLETELIDDGMIAAVVRTLDEWDAHPHAAATRGLPLVTVERIGDAEPIADGPPGTGALDGIRVLDCSRVLAGPVAGQMLAGFGADVLRLGADHLPSIPVGVMSTGFGKRNAFADLRTDAGRSAMRELLASADVWIDAYRPGAFAGHGFDLAAAADLRPGIVVVQISAFDWSGPWAGRRGYDSIVQSTTGVRWAGGEFAVDASGEPIDRGPIGLPVQALDYATGFVAAGVAAQLLAHQRVAGGSWLGRVSLLRARDWLCGMRGPAPYVRRPVAVDDRFVHTVDSDFGRVTTVRPFSGKALSPPRHLGTSPPSWLERPR